MSGGAAAVGSGVTTGCSAVGTVQSGGFFSPGGGVGPGFATGANQFFGSV